MLESSASVKSRFSSAPRLASNCFTEEAPISVDVVGKVIAKLATAPLQQRRHVLESDEIHRLGDENDATKP